MIRALQPRTLSQLQLQIYSSIRSWQSLATTSFRIWATVAEVATWDFLAWCCWKYILSAVLWRDSGGGDTARRVAHPPSPDGVSRSENDLSAFLWLDFRQKRSVCRQSPLVLYRRWLCTDFPRRTGGYIRNLAAVASWRCFFDRYCHRMISCKRFCDEWTLLDCQLSGQYVLQILSARVDLLTVSAISSFLERNKENYVYNC